MSIAAATPAFIGCPGPWSHSNRDWWMRRPLLCSRACRDGDLPETREKNQRPMPVQAASRRPAAASLLMPFIFTAQIASSVFHRRSRHLLRCTGNRCRRGEASKRRIYAQELSTAAQVGAPIIVLMVSNGLSGKSRMHQIRRFPGRPSATMIEGPDIVAFSVAWHLCLRGSAGGGLRSGSRACCRLWARRTSRSDHRPRSDRPDCPAGRPAQRQYTRGHSGRARAGAANSIRSQVRAMTEQGAPAISGARLCTSRAAPLRMPPRGTTGCYQVYNVEWTPTKVMVVLSLKVRTSDLPQPATFSTDSLATACPP
jgi:hypothetical protein